MELARCPLGIVVLVGCGPTPAKRLFIVPAGLEGTPAQWAAARACGVRPSAKPPFIVWVWRLRSEASLGPGWRRERAWLPALLRGACALSGRSLPFPLCVGRVWNNVIAQRNRRAPQLHGGGDDDNGEGGWGGGQRGRDLRDAPRPASRSSPSLR